MLRLFDAYAARQAVIVNPRHSPMLDEVLAGTQLELRRAAVRRWRNVTHEALLEQAAALDRNGGEPAARPSPADVGGVRRSAPSTGPPKGPAHGAKRGRSSSASPSAPAARYLCVA